MKDLDERPNSTGIDTHTFRIRLRLRDIGDRLVEEWFRRSGGRIIRMIKTSYKTERKEPNSVITKDNANVEHDKHSRRWKNTTVKLDLLEMKCKTKTHTGRDIKGSSDAHKWDTSTNATMSFLLAYY